MSKGMLQEIVVVLLVVVLVMLLLLQLQIVQKVVHGNSATATTASKCTGNSATATKLQTTRKITLDGAVKGEIGFDGSSDVVINTIQNNIAIINGQMILEANSQSNVENNLEQQTILNIDFPKGFNKDNCVCIAFGMKTYEEKNYSYGVAFTESNRFVTGSYIRNVVLGNTNDDNSKISLHVWNMTTAQHTVYYRLVLMKIPTYVEGVDYKLGDVNEDGNINKADLDLLGEFLTGNAPLTEKQIKAADINRDGTLNTADTLRLAQYINGQISSFN